MEHAAAVPATPAAAEYEQKHSWYKLSMWLFLASEVMFFAGLFDSYVVLRTHNPEFKTEGQKVLHHTMPHAAVNTALLILSSLTMALAVSAAHRGDKKLLAPMLFCTMLLACGFLVIKYFEYMAKFTHPVIKAEMKDGKAVITEIDPVFKSWNVRVGDEILSVNGQPLTDPKQIEHEHLKPFSRARIAGHAPNGKDITIPLGIEPATNVFFSSYFVMTGLHGVHVFGGVVALFFLWISAMRGKLHGRYTPVEMTGLYWHFVDLVWIFLFPALYLI